MYVIPEKIEGEASPKWKCCIRDETLHTSIAWDRSRPTSRRVLPEHFTLALIAQRVSTIAQGRVSARPSARHSGLLAVDSRA